MCIRDRAYGAQRNDIITSVETGSPEGMVALCGGVQAGSPVDSFAAPEPGDMPGYEDPVIMAAGAFTTVSYTHLDVYKRQVQVTRSEYVRSGTIKAVPPIR